MFKFYPQYDQMDCGPACIKMVARFHGKFFSLKHLRDNSFLAKDGVSVLGICQAANAIGLETATYKTDIETLTNDIPLPAILHWGQNHFVVLYAINKKHNRTIYKIADPGFGLIKLYDEDFKNKWLTHDKDGIVIVLNPTEHFFTAKEVKKKHTSYKFFLKYIKDYKSEFLKLSLALLLGSIITLIFPFLTQALIDKGILFQSSNIVFLILLAQILLFFGSSVIDVIKNWILLHIGAKISIVIISDFLAKLLKLPIKYFDTKIIGDLTQRINDHSRIENFITSDSLFTLFSLVNFLVFFFVLAVYNIKILFIYLFLTLISVFWTLLFFRKRKLLDYNNFQHRSENQDSIFELITGMQEIKLNNFQEFKREQWEKIQIKLFKVNTKILSLNQYQIVGYNFINQFKNIVITFFAAQEVINNNITLGAMLSISYIIGQMNSPINQLISFFRSLQDAKISVERLDEIHSQEDEELGNNILIPTNFNQDIVLEKIDFQYGGPKSLYVLKNITLELPKGKITAIVGASGSGKTTLMKILLKFYSPQNGVINIGNNNIEDVSPTSWRENIGVVMQEGFLFSDTIARNIATSDEEINLKKLNQAIHIANLTKFIESRPLGINTKIGNSGNGVSGGEKQRILIARAVYKNPSYLFFDEATSALDSANEKIIMTNLNTFFRGKTVMVIAHRLSTVKNADQIIVLNKGLVVEQGTHETLTHNKGYYYSLVKNQLELGS
ncbi:MAG: peptidase domain-containing ABC transporter [bacterium]|nr:peptidase domain-containing ABC transporter [bacterium]